MAHNLSPALAAALGAFRTGDAPSPVSEPALTEDRHADYEERAAILEYEQGLTRPAAERLAAQLTGYHPDGAPRAGAQAESVSRLSGGG